MSEESKACAAQQSGAAMKTNFILKFDFQDATKEKVLVARMKLKKSIFGAKFLKVYTCQPAAVQYVLTSPFVDKGRFFSNNPHNRKREIVVIGLSGMKNEFPMVPIDPSKETVDEVEIFMFFPIKKDSISEYSKSWSRVDFFIFHDGEVERPLKEIGMKKTFFFLKLRPVEGTNDSVVAVDYKLPRPIYGTKEIQIVNWITGSGYNFIMSPIIEGESFVTNDDDFDMPVVAYGINGISRKNQRMKIRENCSTLSEISLKMIKTNKSSYPMRYVLVYFIIFHD